MSELVLEARGGLCHSLLIQFSKYTHILLLFELKASGIIFAGH